MSHALIHAEPTPNPSSKSNAKKPVHETYSALNLHELTGKETELHLLYTRDWTERCNEASRYVSLWTIQIFNISNEGFL